MDSTIDTDDWDTETNVTSDLEFGDHLNSELHRGDALSNANEDNGTLIKNQGLCLILNYQDFKKGRKIPPRLGSKCDLNRLKHDFQHLGFDVRCFTNLIDSRTREELENAANYDHVNSRYFVCCILSHGKLDEFCTFDGWFIIDELYSYFANAGVGMPKIFIIQACQGNKEELGVKKPTTDVSLTGDIQYYSDFIVMKSSYPETVSYKTLAPPRGSYFINEFCSSLEMFSDSLDLMQIFNIVTYRFVYFFKRFSETCPKSEEKKQMPLITSTLRFNVNFEKKIPPYDSESTSYFQEKREELMIPELSINPLSEQYWNAKKIGFLSLVVMNDKLKKNSSNLKTAASQLQTYFADKTQFQEVKEEPLLKSQINSFLNSNREYSNADCLVCFIAAYSNGDTIFDKSGSRKLSRQKDILAKFDGENCPDLVGKPKVFIFLMIDLPCANRKKKSFSNTPTDSTDSPQTDSDIYIPVHADILEILIRVTDPQYIEKSMEIFCKTLQEQSSSEDLLSIMSTINSRLVGECNFFPKESTTTNSAKSSFFVINSTLSKKLYLL